MGGVEPRVKRDLDYHGSIGGVAPRRSKSSRANLEESAASVFRRSQIERQIELLRQDSRLQMNELAIRLGLGEDQVDKLERLVVEKLRHYRSELLSQDPSLAIGWRLDMLNLTKELADEILTDSQRQAFRRLKEREREARIEAAALVELSKLNTLGLDEDQKHEVFEVLIEKDSDWNRNWVCSM